MKHTYFLLLLALLTHCQPTTPDQITAQEVIELLHDWEDAYIHQDTALMNRILHEDWVYCGNKDGTTSDKNYTLKELAQADYQFLSMEFSEIDIRLYDDMAIVRARELITMKLANGDTLKLPLRFTDVYQKENGRIQALTTHSSPIEASK